MDRPAVFYLSVKGDTENMKNILRGFLLIVMSILFCVLGMYSYAQENWDVKENQNIPQANPNQMCPVGDMIEGFCDEGNEQEIAALIEQLCGEDEEVQVYIG